MGTSDIPQPTMSRPWKEIARELANQADYRKMAELSEELNRALAEQKAGTPSPHK